MRNLRFALQERNWRRNLGELLPPPRRSVCWVGISFVTTGERLRFNGRMNVLIWYCTLWPRWEVDGTSEIHIVCSQPFPPVPSPKLGKWDKFDHFPVVEQLIHGWWRAEISWTTTRILPKLSYFTSLCHHVQAPSSFLN